MTAMVVVLMNLQRVVQFVLIGKNKITMIKKYVKKPVIIEAIQWTGENLSEIDKFVQAKVQKRALVLIIPTLEGKMRASLNGYTGLEMIDMFLEAGPIPDNIIFSKEWIDTGKL